MRQTTKRYCVKNGPLSVQAFLTFYIFIQCNAGFMDLQGHNSGKNIRICMKSAASLYKIGKYYGQ